MKKIIALLLACIMVVGLFAGCGKKDDNTLVWYYVGNGMPENYESWSKAFNEYVEPKIGMKVEIQCIGWGDWTNVRSVTIQTGDNWDLMFTDAGSYYSDIDLGALADLTPYMDQVPGLTDLIPQPYFDACKVDGKLYAIPAYKDSSMTDFFVWNKDSVEAYFPGYADAHTLAEAYEGLKAINAATGEIWGVSGSIGSIDAHSHDSASLGRCGIGINVKTGTEFVAMYEDEALLSQYRILHQMFNDGLINSDAATRTGEYDGPTVVGTAQGWPSAGVTVWGPSRGEEVVCVQYEDTLVSNGTIMGSMTAINASSDHVLEALKFIELVNTDSYVRDMLGYGEEGVQWEYTEAYGEKRVHKIEGAPSWSFAAYTQGTFFNWTLTDDVETNYWVEEVQKQNEEAIPSPALGFVVDTSVEVNGQTVGDHINGFCATITEYFNLFASGTADPDATVAEMMGVLRQADFDAVLAEINRQYAEFLASK